MALTQSPLQRQADSSAVHARRRKLLLIGFGIAMVALDAAMLFAEHRLDATGGPSILELEFAGSRERLTQITSEWGPHALYLARLSLWIDFGFMVSYGAFFTLAGLATRDFARAHNRPWLATAGIVAPFFAAAAAFFDACENVIWLLALGRHAEELIPVATGCATLKFSLIGLAISYALWGALTWIWAFRTNGSR